MKTRVMLLWGAVAAGAACQDRPPGKDIRAAPGVRADGEHEGGTAGASPGLGSGIDSSGASDALDRGRRRDAR